MDLTAILAAGMNTKGDPHRVERPEFLTRPAPAPGDRSAGIAHALGVMKASSRG